ncbi:hypothetical protein E2C01_074303 [Portunus trituberculatus]|nr:hypothetical protein [Portunus trituberculatus]
MRVLRVA